MSAPARGFSLWLAAACLLLALSRALAAGTEAAPRPLTDREKMLIADAVTAGMVGSVGISFRWFSYRPGSEDDALYCAFANILPPSGGFPVMAPFIAVVGPVPGPLKAARLVALGGAEPLAPLNLLITEMCAGYGYGF